MSRESISRSSAYEVKEEMVRIPLRKILDCFFLLRIPLLVPVWTILMLGWITGTSLAVPGGFLAGSSALSWEVWRVLVAFSLIVASIYVVNQIVDIESDRINRKLFLLPHGFVSVRTAWILAVVCALAGLAIAVFSVASIPIIIIFLLSLILGTMYNLPPVQLKNRALGGVAANALGHGMLTFLVGWYIANGENSIGLSTLLTGLLSGLAPALANGAVYLATTIPDAGGDRQTGKRTFCVAYGEKKTAIASALLCSGAFISSFAMQHHLWVMAVPSGISLVLFMLFAASTKREHAFKAFKWPVFLLSAFVAFFAPEYGILILLTFFGSKAYYKWRFNINYPTLKTK
jgi:4-hydroxybenzoate polyprenyltransferase